MPSLDRPHDPDSFDWTAAPMRIGKIRLRVRDLPRVSDFYERLLGLGRMADDDGRVTLGASAPLLDLVGDPSSAPRDPRAAGLFHTAFLLPTRADLARWLGFANERRIPLQGASDHIVSEAIYLADPEGNGIEVYADRPPSRWRDDGGEIRMATEPLDAEDLLAAAGDGAWRGFPDAGFIGHVHLQVGDTSTAERFYRDVLGFEVTCRYPGARFFGSGGYHHQLAANVWNSRGASRRADRVAGLEAVEIVIGSPADREAIVQRADAHDLEVAIDADTTLRDPWGHAITLVS